jgi:hypothetical protein
MLSLKVKLYLNEKGVENLNRKRKVMATCNDKK